MLLGLLGPFAHAQRPNIEPPVEGRPVDFSNIVGAYSIRASAAPVDVDVGAPITLTVRITGAGPAKYEPRRQNLHVLPDWSNDFYVEPVPDEDRVDKQKKSWSFVYRLRPKHVQVSAIDDIKLVYFDPAAQKYATRFVDPIENISVKPKRDVAGDIAARIEAPASFWNTDQSIDLRQTDSSFVPSAFLMTLVLVLPPLACFVIFVAWRHYFPDADHERIRVRRQAAARALAALQLKGDFAWLVLRQYLEDRFDFGIDDPTPEDAAHFLKRRGFARECSARVAAFLQRCDSVRFAQGSLDAKSLTDEAARLIDMLEADPCAR
jgi:hypothetical protein